ncbi:MAG: YlbF family regulator [Thermoflexaceae bacterium]|nr:YlbF family regulator [Thermoflexaceae bacterium]
MSRVDELASELAMAIVESEEYKNFIQCKEEISKNPQLFQAVNELRRHNFELQNSEEVKDMYDEVVKIFDKYAYIRTNTSVNRFLRAELSVCRMVQDIQRTLIENMDFEVDFLE